MDKRLISFLSSCQVKPKEPYTHVLLFEPKGKYFIDRDHEEGFWNLYCELVKENTVLGLASRAPKPDEKVPVIVDVDLRFNIERGLKRFYTDFHVKSIIKIYQDV